MEYTPKLLRACVAVLSLCVLVPSISGAADPYSRVANLSPSDGGGNGGIMVMDGDTVAMSAVSTSSNGPGKVYVYTKPATGWQGPAPVQKEDAILQQSDGIAGDNFGGALAIDGDIIVVGAYSKDSAKGAVYVYRKPANGWSGTITESAKLSGSDLVAYDYFGTAVAVHGNTIVATAKAKTVSGTDNYQGAGYVFDSLNRDWISTSQQSAILLASDSQRFDYMGNAAAIYGGVVVLGASSKNNGNGQAYVFQKPPAGWSNIVQNSAVLLPTDPKSNDWFGYAVDIYGDNIVVGAPNRNQDSEAGIAYVFSKSAAGWTGTLNESARLSSSHGKAHDWFGRVVAITSDTIVVNGYPSSDSHGNGNYGSGYVFKAAAWSGALTETAEIIDSVTTGIYVGLGNNGTAGTSTGNAGYVYSNQPDVTPTTPAGSLKAPKLLSPKKNAQTASRFTLDWGDSAGAANYQVELRMGGKNGAVKMLKTVAKSKAKTPKLAKATYFWKAAACNSSGCTWSKQWKFTVKKK